LSGGVECGVRKVNRRRRRRSGKRVNVINARGAWLTPACREVFGWQWQNVVCVTGW